MATRSDGDAARDERMQTLATLVSPWRWLTDPVFHGLERIPEDRPLFFVGNHTLMGMLDVPLMMAGLWQHKRIAVHPLGDRLHFQLPGWRQLVESFGVIEGSRESCRAAMREDKSLLVFPGGGREVTKRRTEKYKLVWGDRLGFARMAIESGYTIVPFASVGADDCWDILIDGDDIMRTPIGKWVERLNPRPDLLPPLLSGLGGSILPRPERFYFHFGAPIETAGRRRGPPAEFERACGELRDEVRFAVEHGLAALLEARRADPERDFGARLRQRLHVLAGGEEAEKQASREE